MNPVLASTLEFDAYVNEKLKASRGVSSSRQSVSSQRQRQDISDSQARLSVGGTGIASSSSRPKSASTTQRNANRYSVGEQHTTVSVNRRKVDEPEASPKVFEISHSWKAHIKPPDRRNPVAVPTVANPFAVPGQTSSTSGRTTEPWRYIPERDRRYESKFVEDEDFQSDENPPPPPYLDVLTESFAKELSIDAPSSVISSTFDSQQSNLKIRIFRLKKLFRGWRAYVQRIRPWFQRVERSISRMHQEYLLLTFFDTWRREYMAHTHFQVWLYYIEMLLRAVHRSDQVTSVCCMSLSNCNNNERRASFAE